MKKWFVAFSIGLNLALMAVLVFLNERYGFLRKIQRVALEEGRVLGLVPHHELNRNYQARRDIFRVDRNKSARVLMLGDSLTAQGEWNAMLGAPLVANRGIDGDTSAGVLARLDDDADFHGDAVVIWIGTNDVLQGWAAGPVVERIMEAARGKAEKMKRILTTIEHDGRCEKELPKVGPKSEGVGTSESKNTEEEAGLGLGKPSGPASLATAPEAQVFVLGIPPIARWWEGARERNAVIREINTKLAEGANKNGYRFIELDSVLADENGFLIGEMTSDGVHLSAKGYVAVLEKMKQGPLRGR